ncbi:ABC transporter substrate-binding protein [Allohahella marinimesophila]|uniref:Iron-siderophore ABC transporter substrate-binding protein YiuA n=1 Tax=Allohahella marinimesophila TaxID=1054972 RepID=A0ABP7NXB1_9GAMM
MIVKSLKYHRLLPHCIAVLLLLLLANQVTAMTVTDLAGRQVDIPAKVERLILGESRYIPALAILDRERPLKRIVGMLADFKLADPGSYRQYQQAFPHIDDIPQIGHASAESFSIEQVLTLDADLAIFGIEGHGPSARDEYLIDLLQRAGVTVVFIDFRREPLENTPRSIELLGKVLDREAEASEFLEFYQAELMKISSRLKDDLKAPKVFLHSRVGIQDLCCETMVNGMMGDFLQYLNAENVAAEKVPGHAGVMNLEFLLTEQPAVYIATAIGSDQTVGNEPRFIALGAGIDEDTARQSFSAALSRSGTAELTAVRQGRAHAIWHHFYNTPLNVVAVQAMAKWLYPERFSDIDPQATLAELFRRFQPVPLEGTYWVDLDASEFQ